MSEFTRLAWAARGHPAVIVVTVGADLVPLVLAMSLLAPRTPVIVIDFLLPSRLNSFHRFLARRVSHVVCIRSRDIELFKRRLGFSEDRLSFVHWPSPQVSAGTGLVFEAKPHYIYSAGWAHRDWPTLLAAVADLECHVRIAGEVRFEEATNGRARVEILGPLSPEDGRRWMKDATLVVLPFLETELPSGPLVLLDAMSHGKPVICTRTGGTIDYVDNEQTGILVAPNDVEAMRHAIRDLLSDRSRRFRMGQQAAASAANFTPANFWNHVHAVWSAMPTH